MERKKVIVHKKKPESALTELRSRFIPYVPEEKPDGSKLFIPRRQSKVQWPNPLRDEAFHGLAGEYVKTIIPETESDPAALLIQFLVAFGNVIGRTAHFKVEQDVHYLNLFACLVGQSSRGRKGVSWNHAKTMVECLDREWVAGRIMGGLSTGEGLIEAVRDARTIVQRGNKKVELPGVTDKRLMIVESEFARVLKVMNREGNTLSAILRQAWDGDTLNVLTRADPIRATAPHISIVSHVTEQDLKRHLTDTDAANGFGNRFIWMGVKRTKLLPEGGRPNKIRLLDIQFRLRSRFRFAKKCGEMQRDDKAREAWAEIYKKLAEDQDGMYGTLTSRAEPQIMRIACLYALLDNSATVRVEHLRAAHAVWAYADASVAYLFGGSLGDPVADTILANLIERSEGITRSGIHNVFSNQKSAERIQNALDRLEKRELAYCVPEPTGGRPTERWFAR